VAVRPLTRYGSDHTPLIIDSGDQVFIGNKSNFSFELSWLKIVGFSEIVSQQWVSVSEGTNPMERWQNKIRHLRQFLRGWARDLSGHYKIEKERLSNIIDLLDKKSEDMSTK
jgi:hypothetical protein